jgi:shikimate kinase
VLPVSNAGGPARAGEGSRRQIVLVGMMGVGKTTVGRMLAAQLGWEFWDNDEALRETTGQTAAQVQQARGQSALHRMESRLLRRALREHARAIFAAAGSVVLQPEIVSSAVTSLRI